MREEAHADDLQGDRRIFIYVALVAVLRSPLVLCVCSLTRIRPIGFSLNNLKGRAMWRAFLGSPSCRPRVPPARGGWGGMGGGGLRRGGEPS